MHFTAISNPGGTYGSPCISKSANLENVYTNHCIRVSVVTILQEKGIPNEEIAKVTGHKNPMSVYRYSRYRKDDKLQLISGHLNSEKSNNESYGTSKRTYEMAIENGMKENEMECIERDVCENNCTNINQNFHESITKETVQSKFIFSNCTFNNCSF